MASRTSVIIIFQVLLLLIFKFQPSKTQSWIQAGYWYSGSGYPVSGIDSALFTHLFCAFAYVNSSTYELSISYSDEQSFSTFTATVRQRNPSVKTLLSIGGGSMEPAIFSSVANRSSHRKSFIESSIKTARIYGFDGLDLMWVSPETIPDMTNLGTLIEEWRAAAAAEAAQNTTSGVTQLILTAAVEIFPTIYSAPYPVNSMEKDLNWINVMAYEYHLPNKENHTGALAALYDPTGDSNSDDGIKEWISMGMSSRKLVLGFPYHGYAWELVNPKESYIGAAAKGPAISEDGSMSHKDVKDFMKRNGVVNSVYNDSYVVNLVTVGSTWIAFDDVEAIRTKVSYAKKNRLLGYYAWQVSLDENWVLSTAAQGVVRGNPDQKRRILIISLSIAAAIILASFVMYYLRTRKLKSRAKELESNSKILISAEESDSNELNNLQVFRYADVKTATSNFSFENKLGEGGFGPVYKGTLQNGMAIAVKKLSKSSKQGFEEFRNEVSLTAKLQHVNLVKLLGFCIQGDEQMLIYEYMPNKSLDLYIFEPSKRLMLDWPKRTHIIEGVTQGLLYLQEYSRLTIIHRDLKAGNILLDDKMNAKISDFGMAKIFEKEELEANTDRIVGTFGYAPPEYLKDGIYSMKSDVYSFGILLLQIISGKKNAYLYGPNEGLHLLDYSYELWKQGREMEFMDSSLDDRFSNCKLKRCLQIGLLCVQENANDRPSILEISSMLKNETMAMTAPKKPAFSKRRNQESQENGPTPQPQLEIMSVNNASLSQLEGR